MWEHKTDLDEETRIKKMKWNHQTLFRVSIITSILLGCAAIYNLRLDKQTPSENRLNFTKPLEERSDRGQDIGIVSGEETESNSAAYSSQSSALSVGNNLPQINFSKIEDPTPSFQKYAYISGDLVMDEYGIIRVKKDSIGSKNIKRHSIESEDLDGNSITSGKIRNNSILGKDINRETEITVAEVIADDLAALNLAITQSIDLGTNQISDGLFSGNWDFGSGNITTSGTISGSFAGSFAPSGDVDMANHIFTNIGNAGTDFTSVGGLDLAGNFNVNSGKLFVDATSGKVAIGTTSPLSLLHIQTESSGEQLRIYRYENTNSGANIKLYQARGTAVAPIYSNVNDGDYISFRHYGRNAADTADSFLVGSGIYGEVDSKDAQGRLGGRLSFYTSSGVSADNTEKMRITSIGNVGIGTTSPQASLDLNPKGPYTSFSGKVSSSGTTLNFTEAADLAKCTVGSSITVGSESALIISIDSSLTATVRDAPSPAWSGADITSVQPPTFIARAPGGTAAAFTVAGDANQTTLLHSLQVLSGGTGLDIREDVSITGSSDEQQLLIRGYDSQTSPVVTVQAGAVSPYDIFRIENSGLTRIGYSTATSGTAKLAINGGVSINKETNAAALDVQGEAFFGDGTRTGYFTYSSGNNSTVMGSKTNNALEIRTNNLNRMWLDTSGNVGIGTISPLSKLHIRTGAAGGAGSWPSANADELIVEGSTNAGITIAGGETSLGTIAFAGSTAGTSPGRIIYNNDTEYMSFETNMAERVRIANNGYVGIGTTSPNSILSLAGNLSIGNVAAGTSGTRVLVLSNGTIPSTSPADSIQLYSEDVSDSSELKVRDETGNITTLSPHNFSLIPEGRSEDLAWSYYSQRGNKAVNVDMAKAVRLIEQLSGEQLIYLKNLKSGSYDESLPDVETPLAIKELQEQSQNIATLQLQTTDSITTLEGLKNLVDKNSKTLEEGISSLDENISDISDRMETLEEQIAKIRLQNSEEGIGLIETRLGNLEIALNVVGSDVNILGSLSVAGNVDLLSGKLTAEDIEALGTVKAKNIEAEETIKGDNLELGEETRGKAEIEAGDKEAEIETKAVSNSSQIYITPLGKLGGGNLYVDMDDVKEGKSFKVKLDGEELDSDIEFNWLIIK